MTLDLDPAPDAHPWSFKRLPQSPGVYLMRDKSGKILYVGKAVNLRKRVASYFQKKDLAPKIAALVSVVQQVDYLPAHSERESLLLEQKLIRRLQPLYNTMWRDDKSYPFVELTLQEDYPRLILTRNRKRDGGLYFGPFPNVRYVRGLLKTLWRHKIFPLRPCRFPFQEKDILAEGGLEKTRPALYKKVKSCIYLHTGECPAPCVNRISREKYGDIAATAALFFRGRRGSVRARLEKSMREASRNLEYERAARLRDHLAALEHISEKVALRKVDEASVTAQLRTGRALRDLQDALGLARPPLRIEGFDISNIRDTEPVASMVFFENGKPAKAGYRKFKIKTVGSQNDFAMMAEVIGRRYGKLLREGLPFPDLILIDGGKGQLSAALEALAKLKEEHPGRWPGKVDIASLAKQEEEIYLPGKDEPVRLSRDNPALHVLQAVRDEAHRFAVSFHRQRRHKLAFR